MNSVFEGFGMKCISGGGGFGGGICEQQNGFSQFQQSIKTIVIIIL